MLDILSSNITLCYYLATQTRSCFFKYFSISLHKISYATLNIDDKK